MSILRQNCFTSFMNDPLENTQLTFYWRLFDVTRLQRLTALLLEAQIFCDVTQCGLMNIYRRFALSYCLHYQ
jgi:hypothetical protein